MNRRFAELLTRFLPRLRGKVWLAIDFHHEARYGKKLTQDEREIIHLSLINKQVPQVTSYATLAIVSLNGKYTVPFTVTLSLNYKGHSRVAVIGDLLGTFFRYFEFAASNPAFQISFALTFWTLVSVHLPPQIVVRKHYKDILKLSANKKKLKIKRKSVKTRFRKNIR